MLPQDFDQMLKRQPFEPFRVHMSNGRTYDVRHRENALLTEEAVVLPVYEQESDYPKTFIILSLMNMNEFEPLSVARN